MPGARSIFNLSSMEFCFPATLPGVSEYKSFRTSCACLVHQDSGVLTFCHCHSHYPGYPGSASGCQCQRGSGRHGGAQGTGAACSNLKLQIRMFELDSPRSPNPGFGV
eukprot:206979-Rhodomonas_salina.1